MTRVIWAGALLGVTLIIVGTIGDEPAPACIEVVGADCPPESSSPPVLVVLGAVAVAASLGLATILKLLSLRNEPSPAPHARATITPTRRPSMRTARSERLQIAGGLTLLGAIASGFLWFAGWLGSGQCDDACEVEPTTMAKLALVGFACSLMSAIAVGYSFRNPAALLVALFFLFLAGAGFLTLAVVVRLA